MVSFLPLSCNEVNIKFFFFLFNFSAEIILHGFMLQGSTSSLLHTSDYFPGNEYLQISIYKTYLIVQSQVAVKLGFISIFCSHLIKQCTATLFYRVIIRAKKTKNKKKNGREI